MSILTLRCVRLVKKLISFSEVIKSKSTLIKQMLATGQIFVKESEVLLQLAASSVKMKSPALFKI